MKIYWKQAFLFLLIGLLVGGVIGRLSCFARFDRESREDHINSLISRFGRDLDLTPDQKSKVAVIIRSKRDKIDALRAEVRPKFDQLWAEAKFEIGALLEDRQKVKFQALEERMDKMRQRHRESIDKSRFF